MSTGILDTYTARIAYALRRLKSTYSGNCLRVRRSSDDTEQDIGFDSDGIINWSGASSFAGGNDLFVVKQYDQSGNGNHRSQATNSKQPKLNLSTHQIEFDGTDDYLATESAVDLSATDKLSFYTKLKRLGSPGTYQFFAFTVGSNGLQCYFYLNNSKYTIFDSNTAANWREDSTSISGAGTERLISVIIDRALTTSSEMLFYADNTSQTGGSAGNNSGNFPSAIWQFGVYSATMHFGNYQQSEFILFDSAHDGTDRTFIESDISSGLGATPPPDSTPPTDCVLGTPTALTATSARFPISTLSTDAGAGMQKYLFEFDTVDTFDSADKITVYHNATTSPFDKTGLTAGRRWFARAKGVDNAATPNLSTNWSNTVHVDLAPTINTTSLNSAIIHEPFSQTLSKTGGAGTFEIRSGAPSGFAIDDETGEITWGDSDPLGEIEDIVIRYTVTASGLYAEVTFSITVVETDFDPFEILDHVKMLNLNGLGWSAPLIEANFGGGFGAGIIANQDYGLHRWTIASEFLPDHSYEIDANIDGETVTQKYFTYVFEFFKRHTLRGNKPFVIKEHRTGNYYLVRFAMGGAIDFGRLTAKFFTNEGIQVQEARTSLEGFTFAEDGSVTKS